MKSRYIGKSIKQKIATRKVLFFSVHGMLTDCLQLLLINSLPFPYTPKKMNMNNMKVPF